MRLWLFVVLLCLPLVLAGRPLDCDVENCSGLVGLWRLEDASGSAQNFVSGGNNGSVAGNPVRGVAGKVGLAYDFDGSGDEVQVDLGTTSGDMTYAFWFRSDNTGTTKRIVDRSWQVGSYSMGTDHISGNLDVLMVDTGSTERFLSSTAPVQSGAWYFVAVVVNNTRFEAYVDGVLRRNSTIPAGGARSDSNDLFIGSANFNFAGLIDEVYFFNRSLSAVEVARLHNIGTLPNSTSFGAGSTDFANVLSMSNVSGMVLSRTGGSITWAGPIDARDEQYDAHVRIGSGFVSVNASALDSSINSTANVSIEGVHCSGQWSIYYTPGVVESNAEVVTVGEVIGSGQGSSGSCSSVCANPVCEGGVLTFTVSQFSSFGVAGSVPEFGEWVLMVLLTMAFAGVFMLRKN